MTITADDVKAALKKLGGNISPGKLAEELGIEQLPGALIKSMIDEGSIKAAGAARGRRLSLPDQKIDGDTSAPPPAPQAAQDQEGAQSEEGARGTGREARHTRRALRPHGRRGEASAHHQRRRAPELQRHADRGDRHAPASTLRGLR